MNLAFYRKYRPQTFQDLVGQDMVRETLLQALKQGRFVHAYLFSGPRGTGKTSTARLIAKALQCENLQDSGEACGICSVCVRNENQDLIDLVEIDAASNRGIEDIRDLREKIRFAPSFAKRKVYIIDEVHMLTKEAFNALLKSLEEPPEHVFFILATTELHKIPETILSRCQHYPFRRVPTEAIVKQLQKVVQTEQLQVEEGVLEYLAERSQGGLRDALTLLEQLSTETLTLDRARRHLGLKSHQAVDELMTALKAQNTAQAFEVVHSVHREGQDLLEFTVHFLENLRFLLHAALQKGEKEEMKRLTEWISIFDQAWLGLKNTSIAPLPLEIAIVELLHGPLPSYRRL